METPGTITWESLYAAYYPDLRRYLSARTGDRDRAEDLAQDAFLKLGANLPALLARDREVPVGWWWWLKRVATNAHLDATRHEAVLGAVLDFDFCRDPAAGRWHRALNERTTDERTPEAAALDAEAERALAALIDHLPDTYRRTMQLFVREGYSLAEIKARLRYPTLSAVKGRMSRARTLMAQAWPYVPEYLRCGSWGAALLARRRAAGVSRDELARRAGIAVPPIWLCETRDDKHLALGTLLRLFRLCDAHEVDRCGGCQKVLRSPQGETNAVRRFCRAPDCQNVRRRWLREMRAGGSR